MRMDKWATSKSTQLSTVKLLLLLEDALELNFEALKLTENLNGLPPPRPHTHSDPIINKHTEQVKRTMYGRIQLHDTGQNSSIRDHQLCRELEITREYYELLEITTDY